MKKQKLELTVTTDWHRLLHTVPTPLSVEVPMKNKEIFLINDVLNAEECSALLNAAEGYGFGETDYPKDYRGNLRLIAFDTKLADEMWKRLKTCTHIPDEITEHGETYKVVGLNGCWRLSKYLPGDQFQCHVDTYYESEDIKSMFTVNIYMNEEFTGGETVFHLNDDAKQNPRRPMLQHKTTVHEIVPKTGLCLVFRQPPTANLLHEGKEVSDGVKYLFRSDVMYRQC